MFGATPAYCVTLSITYGTHLLVGPTVAAMQRVKDIFRTSLGCIHSLFWCGRRRPTKVAGGPVAPAIDVAPSPAAHVEQSHPPNFHADIYGKDKTDLRVRNDHEGSTVCYD